MKRIKLPLRCMIHSQGEVNLRDVYDLMDAAKVNGLEVINASLAYEKYMEEIIEKYIFIERDDPSIDFFRNHILSADWFSFSAKRNIVLAIVDKENIFSGKDTNILERQLRKTMSYRNAFAHGDIIIKDNDAFISYFEGRKREDKLDDNYWDTLESVFLDVWNFITDIREVLGIKHDVLDVWMERVEDK